MTRANAPAESMSERRLVDDLSAQRDARLFRLRHVGSVSGRALSAAAVETARIVCSGPPPARRDPVMSQRGSTVHSAMLSRATFLMNGVSPHTGSLRISGVTTRGEM